MAKRPDVLVIESGEIELPTKVKGLKSIGLPPNVIYACLAETIVLALEGRFEVFTIGRDTEWEKVKEIYKLGLKHCRSATTPAVPGERDHVAIGSLGRAPAHAAGAKPVIERRKGFRHAVDHRASRQVSPHPDSFRPGRASGCRDNRAKLSSNQARRRAGDAPRASVGIFQTPVLAGLGHSSLSRWRQLAKLRPWPRAWRGGRSSDALTGGRLLRQTLASGAAHWAGAEAGGGGVAEVDLAVARHHHRVGVADQVAAHPVGQHG